MLSRLALGSCETGAKVGSHDNIRHSRICEWIAEALSNETGAGDGLLYLESSALSIEVLHCGRRVSGVVQEDQGNVISLATG